MASFFEKISLLHVELTERCNAACPMCGRTRADGSPNPLLAQRELNFQDFFRIFPAEFLGALRQIRFCGNFGDPAAARDMLTIAEALRGRYPNLTLRMNTNGGLRSTDWWFTLGRLFEDASSSAQFGIDGLSDTHHLHRRGTSFARVLENAAAFIRGGGRAHWVFLVFEHNEHQIEEARELAQQIGFSEFILKRSKRFLSGNSLALRWEQRRGEAVLRPPSDPRLRNDALMELDAAESRGERIAERLQQAAINCRAKRLQELYVSAEGLAFPCCWVGAALYAKGGREPSGAMWTLLQRTGGKAQIDLRAVDIESAVGSRFFAEIVQAWDRAASEERYLCARICGAGVDSFDRQFEQQPLRAGQSSLTVF